MAILNQCGVLVLSLLLVVLLFMIVDNMGVVRRIGGVIVVLTVEVHGFSVKMIEATSERGWGRQCK